MNTNNGSNWNTVTSVGREALGWTSYIGGLYGAAMMARDGYRFGKKHLREEDLDPAAEEAARAPQAAPQAAPLPQPVQPTAKPVVDPFVEALNNLTKTMEATLAARADAKQAEAEALLKQVAELQEQLKQIQPPPITAQQPGGYWHPAWQQPARRTRQPGRKPSSKRPSAKTSVDGSPKPGRRTRSRRMQMQS